MSEYKIIFNTTTNQDEPLSDKLYQSITSYLFQCNAMYSKEVYVTVVKLGCRRTTSTLNNSGHAHKT